MYRGKEKITWIIAPPTLLVMVRWSWSFLARAACRRPSCGLQQVLFDLPEHQFHASTGILHTVMSTILTMRKHTVMRAHTNEGWHVHTLSTFIIYLHCPEWTSAETQPLASWGHACKVGPYDGGKQCLCQPHSCAPSTGILKRNHIHLSTAHVKLKVSICITTQPH